MTARGKHENPGKPAKNTKHVPKHGGPQTPGTGYTAGGKKPDKVEEKKAEGK